MASSCDVFAIATFYSLFFVACKFVTVVNYSDWLRMLTINYPFFRGALVRNLPSVGKRDFKTSNDLTFALFRMQTYQSRAWIQGTVTIYQERPALSELDSECSSGAKWSLFGWQFVCGRESWSGQQLLSQSRSVVGGRSLVLYDGPGNQMGGMRRSILQ